MSSAKSAASQPAEIAVPAHPAAFRSATRIVDEVVEQGWGLHCAFTHSHTGGVWCRLEALQEHAGLALRDAALL